MFHYPQENFAVVDVFYDLVTPVPLSPLLATSIPASLYEPRSDLTSTSIGDLAIFAGGYDSVSPFLILALTIQFEPSFVIDVYNSSSNTWLIYIPFTITNTTNENNLQGGNNLSMILGLSIGLVGGVLLIGSSIFLDLLFRIRRQRN